MVQLASFPANITRAQRHRTSVQGFSLGGMFVHYAASQLSDVVASIAVNSASPLIGFGEVPLDAPLSLIDFHGFADR